MNWRRIVVWSLLILGGTYVVATISALTMTRWEIYGQTIQEAAEHGRLIRRIGYVVVAAALYWRFAAGTPSKRILHVLAVFAVVQILDAAVSVLLGTSIGQLLDPWAVGRSVLAAAAGLGIASLSANVARPAQAHD